jgi:hypothetical protein
MRNYLARLGKPVIHRPVEVIRYLRDLAAGNEGAHCDEAAVERCKAGTLPDIAEDALLRELIQRGCDGLDSRPAQVLSGSCHGVFLRCLY